MTGSNNNDFDCFGSDSEESNESSNFNSNADDTHTRTNTNTNTNTNSNSNSKTNIKNKAITEEDERRQQLMENAKLQQITAKLAEEAHRNRRPLSSPNCFEVFDTTTTTDGSGDAGMGLKAQKEFSCGDEILREYAVMRVPNQQAASSRKEAENLHLRAVQQSFLRLSPETQQAVLDLSNSFNDANDSSGTGGTGGSNNIDTPEWKAKQVLGVYQTNSFQLGGGSSERSSNGTGTASYDQDYGGLFLTIARINHSCRPNANHIWRSDLQQTVVFATRKIQVGDEICTTYGTGEALDTAGRRSYLEERFSFVCGCEMCAEGNAKGGDDRMNELNSRLNEISLLLATVAAATENNNDEDNSGGEQVAEILESVERCLVLLQKQGFDATSGAFVKSILHYGYQACLLMPRQPGGCMFEETEQLARGYLTKELIATENGEGVGSPNALQLQKMVDAFR